MTGPTRPTDEPQRTPPSSPRQESSPAARREQFQPSGREPTSMSPTLSPEEKEAIKKARQDLLSEADRLDKRLSEPLEWEELLEVAQAFKSLAERVERLSPEESEKVRVCSDEVGQRLLANIVDQEEGRISPKVQEILSLLPAHRGVWGVIQGCQGDEEALKACGELVQWFSGQPDEYLQDLSRLSAEEKATLFFDTRSFDFIYRLASRVFVKAETEQQKAILAVVLAYALLMIGKNPERRTQVLKLWLDASTEMRNRARLLTQELGQADRVMKSVRKVRAKVAREAQEATGRIMAKPFALEMQSLGAAVEVCGLSASDLQERFKAVRSQHLEPFLKTEQVNEDTGNHQWAWARFVQSMTYSWPKSKQTNLQQIRSGYQNEKDPLHTQVALAEQAFLFAEMVATQDQEWRGRLEFLLNDWPADDPTLGLLRLEQEVDRCRLEADLQVDYLFLNGYRHDPAMIDSSAPLKVSEVPFDPYLTLAERHVPRADKFDKFFQDKLTLCADSLKEIVQQYDHLTRRWEKWLIGEPPFDPTAGAQLAKDLEDFGPKLNYHWKHGDYDYQTILDRMAKHWENKGFSEGLDLLGKVAQHLDHLNEGPTLWVEATEGIVEDLAEEEDEQERLDQAAIILKNFPPIFFTLLVQRISDAHEFALITDFIIATVSLPEQERLKIKAARRALAHEFYKQDAEDQKVILERIWGWFETQLSPEGLAPPTFSQFFEDLSKPLFRASLILGERSASPQQEARAQKLSQAALRCRRPIEWFSEDPGPFKGWQLKTLTDYLSSVSDEELKALLTLKPVDMQLLFDSLSSHSKGIALLKKLELWAETDDQKALILRSLIVSDDDSRDYLKELDNASPRVHKVCFETMKKNEVHFQKEHQDAASAVLESIVQEEWQSLGEITPEEIEQDWEAAKGKLEDMRQLERNLHDFFPLWISIAIKGCNYTRFQYHLAKRAVEANQDQELPDNPVVRWLVLRRDFDQAMVNTLRAVQASSSVQKVVASDEEVEEMDPWITIVANAGLREKDLTEMGLSEGFSDLKDFGLVKEEDFKVLGLGVKPENDKELLRKFFSQMEGANPKERADKLKAWLQEHLSKEKPSLAGLKLKPDDYFHLGQSPI